MSTSTAASQAVPTPISSTHVTTSGSPEATSKWELGVSLLLNGWKALDDAVTAQWGGPDSEDKRDWLCGAVADMFVERPETDEIDLEETLLHVMDDEFECSVEDGSGYEIAIKVCALRKEILAGNFATVDTLHTAFLSKAKNKSKTPPKVKEVVNEAGDSASDFSEDEEGESDIEMADVPAAASRTKERLEPVVDDDGFELVQKKGGKKR